MTAVFGRETELATLDLFLSHCGDGASALVLEGDAGMGKTTLWRAALETASDLDVRVLRALPAESETALSFAGLGDLLDGALDEALPLLPGGQASALSRALVLENDAGAAPDPHAVGVALLGALRGLARAGPLLIAIDDAQWLDEASAGTLAYASRRLRDEPVRMLFAKRRGTDSALLDELRRSFDDRFVELDVGPLDAHSLHRVVLGHLGTALPRPLLAEIRQAAGGNPFYALEIVRMLQRSDVSIEAGQPIPVPESLHELVRVRLLELTPECRDFLLAAAAHAHPRVAVVEAATGVDRSVALAAALAAGVVELDGDRIRFTHPLLAAGAYDLADPLRRREIHVRLSELLDDPEARAWQLAASVDESSSEVASALEQAAEHARSRGGLRPAALLLDRARDLTPSDDGEAAFRRGVEAAFLHFESGDAQRAEVQLERLIAPLGPGIMRARALWVLARVRTYDAPAEAAELFLSVVEQAGEDRELLAAAHEGVASSLYYAFERFEESARHAEVALRLAHELQDRALEGDVLVSKLGAQALLGDPAARETADEARSLDAEAVDRRILDRPLLAVADYWSLTDAHDEARETLLALLSRAEETGDESSRPYLLCFLSLAELARGRLRDALEWARAGRMTAEQSGETLFAGYNGAVEALCHAQLGHDELARSTARRAFAEARSRYEELVAAAALGHAELVSGAAAAAAESLEPAYQHARRERIAEPGAVRFVADQIEALIELARRDEAVERLDWYGGNARRLERVSALANCARCRGLIAAQDGQLEDALASFGEALEWHAKVEIPLDRGRTLLALGVTQRRMKRRREARATLEEAFALFERIGAASWAERARAELKRISGRAATPGALTPAEQRVATLAAVGKTNKEVAAALFLSDRTVEGHLAHVFGKLGIRHRGELAVALQTQGIALPNTGDSPVSTESAAP